MKTTSKEGKNVEAHLRVWLNQGKKITHLMAWKMWRTNRLAEYVRRCREDGMNIITERVPDEDGSWFGVYYLEKKKKVSKIATRQYLDQAYSKSLV